jgi:hypothetical protein
VEGAGEAAEAEDAGDHGPAAPCPNFPFVEACGGVAPAHWEVAMYALALLVANPLVGGKRAAPTPSPATR